MKYLIKFDVDKYLQLLEPILKQIYLNLTKFKLAISSYIKSQKSF